MFKKFNNRLNNQKLHIGIFSGSSNVGRATIAALSHYFSNSIKIRAIVRNIESEQKLADYRSVGIMYGEIGAQNCEAALNGLNILFIIPPATKDRIERTKITLNLIKNSTIKHVVVMSVMMNDENANGYSKEYSELELFIKSLNVPYTILRTTLFLDNLWIIKTMLPNVSLPIQQDVSFNAIAVADIGVASAFVLAQFNLHINKTYELIGIPISFTKVIEHLSQILSKKITYNTSSIDDIENILKNNKIETWQGDQLKNLCKFINTNIVIPKNNDFKSITGQNYTSLTDWLLTIQHYFKSN